MCGDGDGIFGCGRALEAPVADYEALRLTVAVDGTRHVIDESDALSYTPLDDVALTRIAESRRGREPSPSRTASLARTSSTDWALDAAREALPALEGRRRGAGAPGDGVITFTLVLADALTDELPLRNMRSMNERARATFSEERRVRAEEAHRGVLERLRADPRVHHAEMSWLTEDIYVTADADLVPEVARWREVERISPNARIQSNGAYSGYSRRLVTRAQNEIDVGNRGRPTSGNRITVAIIDRSGRDNQYWNWPLVSHAAFRESATDATSRFTRTEDCNACAQSIISPVFCVAWGCRPLLSAGVPFNPTPRSSANHSTPFAFLVGGSIEEGQVPSITANDMRVARSGIASEVALQYFGVNDCDAIGRAIVSASGANVVALAATVPETPLGCPQTFDCGNIAANIEGVRQFSQLMMVAAAGQGSGSTCSMQYPAYHPNVLGVGSYDNSGAAIVPLNYTAAPIWNGSAPIWSGSPSGDMTISLALSSNITAGTAAMGVVAPAQVTFLPNTAPVGGVVPTDQFSTATATGTSWSAAMVAGGVALQTEAFREQFGVDVRGVQALAMALLAGDAWGAVSGTRVGEPDVRSGFGRYRTFSPATLVGATWGIRSAVLGPGVYEFQVGGPGPETGVQQWRWVALAAPRAVNNIQVDFVIEAVDSCHGNAVIAADYSFGLRKRVWLDANQICPPSLASCRCLVQRMTVLHTGFADEYATADFFHSGSEAL